MDGVCKHFGVQRWRIYLLNELRCLRQALPTHYITVDVPSMPNVNTFLELYEKVDRAVDPEPDNSMKSSFKEEWSAKKASSDIPKPQNSRVILKKDEESLEIIFPLPGFSKAYVALITFAVMFIIPSIVLVAILFGMYWADFSSKIVLALFSIPWWIFAIAMFFIFANYIGKMLTNRRLEINQQKISLSHQILGFKIYEENSNLRQDINKLERIKRHIKLSSLPDYAPEYLGSIYESEIIISAGESKYRISISLVSEDELDWLATELNDWLGLPIDKA